MSLKISKWKEWVAKLKNVYRFQIVDEKSYDVKLVWELNRLNVLIGAGLLLAIFTVLNFIFIAFTPLKQYIPGYGSSDRKDVIKVSMRTEELEEKVNAQQKYITNIQNILNDKIVVDAVKSNLKKTKVDTGILSVKSPNLSKFVKEVEKGLKNAELMENVYDHKTSVLQNLEIIAPLSGNITTKFSETNPFIVIQSTTTKEVKAILSGNVILVDNEHPNQAFIAIQAENQLVYILKNNTQVLKKIGNFVEEGETIALAGKSTNNNYATTLELWYRGQAINAAKFIK
ncbi:MAG: peptidoglycan DD-metalloendopeptidase family protein [Chitinophagales bacterium]